MGPVGGVSSKVPPAALPADRRVCVGLVVGPLLDVPLRHRQHHAAVGARGLRLVETLVSSCLQVQAGLRTVVLIVVLVDLVHLNMYVGFKCDA